VTDAHMLDLIRVPHNAPYWADDDQPDDEILPHTMHQLEAAGQRAVTWRVQCAKVAGAKTDILNSITFSSRQEDLTMPDREGWMRIGWVADPWIGGSLRVFWHPGVDRVRVDRPPRREAPRRAAAQEQSPSPRVDGKINYVAVIRIRDDGTVTLEVRPLYSGQPQSAARHMRIVVPDDGNAYFAWAMEIAARTYNTVYLPGDFWERTMQERRDILIKLAHELAACKAGKHR